MKSWVDALATRVSPNRVKHRNVVLLRGLLIVAVGALLVDAGVRAAGLGALALVAAFAVSDIVLARLPFHVVGGKRFDLLVGGLDLALVALGLYLAGAARGALPVSCLLMVLVVALASRYANAVAGAAAVGALHTWLVLQQHAGPQVGRQLVLQTLFLCAVGLYYGVLVEGIHRSRRERHAEDLERRELTTLLEILDDVTSSLDLHTVVRKVVGKLTDVVPAVRCSMVYVDEALTRCCVIASHDDPELRWLEIEIAKYPEIRKAIETRQCVIVEDIRSHPLMAEVRKHLVGLDFQSIIVVPITFGADVLGTLCIRTARGQHRFTDREVAFCTAVARASANALKNALLHREVVGESGRHRRTGEKLVKILNNSPDLIMTTDTDGVVTEFNRGAERLLGYPKDEVLGRHYRMLLADSEEEGPLLEQVLSFGVLPNYAQRMRKRTGDTLDVELHMSVLKEDDERVVGSVWVGRDVTALKAAQMRLMQAEKLSSIGEVISGVAHELNNPLSGVLGFSQLLMARHGDGPHVREIQKINESAERCQKIVKNLLSFARAHKPERKYLGLNGIVEKTLDLKRYQLHVNDIEVERDLEPELPRTMVDFHQIQQVLLNLINNAQYAMAAVRERRGRLIVRTTHSDHTIRVEVTDNGEGMDPETLPRIFDPFFTTKEQGQGTGLGLSVSYGIVRQHGGQIYARSAKGQGTTFLVELPVWRESEEASQDPASESKPAAGGVSKGSDILIVDDEPLVIDLLMDVLTELGHRVDTAANGIEACRKVDSRSYDAVITDVRMPQMNGMDLYRDVLAKRPELEGKVIFVTGDLIDRGVVDFLAEVNARTLAKPLEIGQIHEAVREVLARKPDGPHA
jgi:PAS domain S-box-containing protein